MKRLPIGRSDFSSIREEGFVYVDKTELIYKLLINGGRYFLSRPRRFGKSLTVSTLEAIFQGKRDLFKGLWIEDKIDWKKFPVLMFSFDQITSSDGNTHDLLIQQLHNVAKKNNVKLTQKDVKSLTEELIEKVSKKGKVVILVDEYDKPILDVVPHKMELANERREILKDFFETIKNKDGQVHFVFVTGVSKFAKMTMFSGPNQLKDITLSPKFSAICGYTQEELEFHFSYSFPQIAKNQQVAEGNLISEIKKWYNGYSWTGEHVYNPWSILNMVDEGYIRNYWFNSGSPSFLLRYLKAGLYYKLTNFNVPETVLDSFEIEKIDYRALLFQGGYLTIKSEDVKSHTYLLGFPNCEVEMALSQFMLATFSETNVNDAGMSALDLREALLANDLEQFKLIVNSLFSSIPSPIFLQKYEAYYHAILHTTFTLLGYYANNEVHTSAGRADAVVTLPNQIFIFEFKINDTAKAALQQIKDKNYAGKYAASGKKITLVGVELSKVDKGIVAMEVE
jgi:Predicted AAA-ATPase/PD-(D/E)XK nuclease superfamily